MSSKVKFLYTENYRFRSWLNKIKDKEKIVKEARRYITKARKGNTFMVIGANGYCGWATICQLAFQYSGCNIICCDKNVDSRPDSIVPHYSLNERMEELHRYFSFNSLVIKGDFEVKEYMKDVILKYKPNFVINLADGYSELFNPVMINVLKTLKEIDNKKIHLILSTPYTAVTDFSYFNNYPITELKTAKVLTPFSMITLINKKLATFSSKDTFLNKLILRVIERPEIKYKEQTIISTSLETFTKVIAEIIRTGTSDREKMYRFYKLAEYDLTETMALHILKFVMKKLDNITLKSIRTENKRSSYIYDRGYILKLIKEFEPPLYAFISYSYKYIKDNGNLKCN
jgi:hypothetical protein